MKPIKRSLFIRLGVFIVTAFVIAMVANQVMALNQPVPGSKLPPTPMLQSSDLKASNGEILSQSGQRSISKITDLSLGISEENKMVFVVQRIDGKYEQFFLPANYSGDIRKLMGLKESEKIITGFALISIRSTPVMNKPEMQSTQIPYNREPYPAPLNQESVQSPVNPYPYP